MRRPWYTPQGDRMKRRRKWKEHVGTFRLFESE
jgi:hypothetical protein